MKILLPMFAGLGLFLTGCDDKSDMPALPVPPKTNAPAASGTAPAPSAGYLQNITSQQQAAVKTVDVTALAKAIDMFQVAEGRLPKDLDELVTKKFIPVIPVPSAGSKLVYKRVFRKSFCESVDSLGKS